jgi:tetratricopeptide (TPR) repeat protein
MINTVGRTLFGILLVAMTMNPSVAVTDQFIADIEYAKSLGSKGGVADAIRFWEKKRSVYAKTDGFYEFELGTFYASAVDFPRAEKAYHEAIAINPVSPKFCVGLAFLYLEQKRVADAISWAENAVKANPKDPLGHYALGEIERRQENYAAARDHLKKSLRISPGAHAAWLLAIVSYELNDSETVVQSMEMAVNLDKSYAADKPGMLVTAVSLARLGRFEDAYGALNTLKSNNPKITDADVGAARKEIDRLRKVKSK